MRKRKKIKLSYSKERVLFSDVLPYECPIIFSNRYLYRFLAKYLWVGEEQKVDNITWNVLKQSKRRDEKDAMLLLHYYLVVMKRIKKSKYFNIDQTLYSTHINLISLTRRIRPERCQLYIHITSGR